MTTQPLTTRTLIRHQLIRRMRTDLRLLADRAAAKARQRISGLIAALTMTGSVYMLPTSWDQLLDNDTRMALYRRRLAARLGLEG